MPAVSIESLRAPPYLLVLVLIPLWLLWPHTFHYVLWAIALILTTVLALVFFNIAVLLVYIRYFLSPTKHKPQDFKPLRFASERIWASIEQQRQQENDDDGTNTPPPPLDVAPESKEVSDAFEQLLSYVLRDFIDYWFVYVAGPHERSFRKKVDELIRLSVVALKKRVQEADLVGILVNRLVPIITAHISDFRAAEIALRGRSLERSVTQSDELDLLLASQFRNGRLHSALTTAAVTTKPTEVVHLRKVIEHVMPCVMDQKELSSTPVSVLIREIVSCAILQPVIDMVADPDYWNQTIDTYLGKAIREQKMVHKLREVLNRHSTELDLEEALAAAKPQPSPINGGPRRPSRNRSRPELLQASSLSSIFDQADNDAFSRIRMGKRSFQEFLRMIEDEKNLLELKRVRNDIVTQLRKKRVQIHDRDPDEVMDGERVGDITIYLNRLSVAKRRVDKRIALLTGQTYDKGFGRTFFGGSSHRRRSEAFPSQPFGYSLDDILANPAGLSYFMEFMDRRGDIMKLQFWLIIEGFKKSDPSSQSASTFLQDVNMVYTMYLMESAPHRIILPDPLADDLHEAISRAEHAIQDSPLEIPHAVQRMRLRLYEIQRHVFYQLEKDHFPYFKRSDLYFKFLASTPNVIQEPAIHEDMCIDVTPSNQSSTGSIINAMRPVPLQRTSSASMNKNKSSCWDDVPLDQACRAESDTEISKGNRAKKQQQQDQVEKSARGGHARTLSETAHGGIARFFEWGKTSANDWWGGNESNMDEENNSNSSSSSPRQSLQSFDTDDLSTEDDEDDDQSTTAVDEHIPQQEDEIPPLSTSATSRHPLVRTNTVKAVEAELQSIIDWDDNTATTTDDNAKVGKRKISSGSSTLSFSPPPTPSPKKQISSPLLLRDPRGAKSTTAVPVQHGVTLQSWASSTGSSVIREISDDAQGFDDQNILKTMSSEDGSIQQQQQEQHTKSHTANVHLAPPGDLMLSSAIERLSDEVEKLMQQQAIVDQLIKKAEASNMGEKLRILKKSKAMFRQEIQQLEYQKNQYEAQESENVLIPHRTRVSVTSSTIGNDAAGDFALYVIEIQQLGIEGNYNSGWMVARRYSEFFALHTKLKERYAIVKSLDFPAKWPLLRLQKGFVEGRRATLERYLRRLLEDRNICQSRELRAFLSQQSVHGGFDGVVPSRSTGMKSSDLLKQQLQPSSSTSSTASSKSFQRSSGNNNDIMPTEQALQTGFMRNIYKSVADGIDDLSVAPSMLDFITQQLVGKQFVGFIDEEANTKETNDATGFHATTPAVPPDFVDPLKAQAEEATNLTESLCDLFVEMFELKEKNNWLRRQALVIILQQILGGTIERRLRDTVVFLESEPMIVFYLRKILDSLWPGGQSLTFKPPRQPDEKQRTKEAANRKLSTWLPDLIGQMVGRQNARRGARRLFTVLQNKRLNQDLLYTLFDEIVSALFPEIDLSSCKV